MYRPLPLLNTCTTSGILLRISAYTDLFRVFDTVGAQAYTDPRTVTWYAIITANCILGNIAPEPQIEINAEGSRSLALLLAAGNRQMPPV